MHREKQNKKNEILSAHKDNKQLYFCCVATIKQKTKLFVQEVLQSPAKTKQKHQQIFNKLLRNPSYGIAPIKQFTKSN